jgi:hypothetical protein
VGRAYKQLIADWREVLPTHSVCLQVPIVWPSEYEEDYAYRRRQRAKDLLRKPPMQPSNPRAG